MVAEKEVAERGKGCFDGQPSSIKSGSLRKPKSTASESSVLSTLDYYIDKVVRYFKNNA